MKASNNYKMIDCPAHPKGDHQAILYQEGHEYAGIWECPRSGESDSCPHENLSVKIFEVDTMRNGEHDTYETTGYVCDDCLCQVEGYEPEEPEADRDD